MPPEEFREISDDTHSAIVVLSHSVLPLPEAAAGADLTHFTVEAKSVTGDGIIVRYCGIAGNLPKTYGNTLALWGSSLPNLSSKPLKVVPITANDQPNDMNIDYGISQTSYCVTYQVGGDMTTMSALVQLQTNCPAVSPPNQVNVQIPNYVDIEIDQVTTNSIRVFYSTLPGYQPNKYQNWVGLWQGYASPYDSSDPLAKAVVTNNFTEGFVTISNVPISSKFTYTLIYFTGPAKTNAASLIYFKPELPPQ